jgi:tetratricopeptide (TPR) repeat protein
MGRTREAEALLRESIAILSPTVPPSDPSLAVAREDLALVMMRTWRNREAEFLLLQAVDALENQPSSVDLGFALGNLVTLRRNQARYQEAVELSRRALAILERTLGADHPQLLGVLNNLAFVESETGRRDNADAVFLRALTIAENRLGTAHPTCGQILVNYAVFLRKCWRKITRQEADGPRPCRTSGVRPQQRDQPHGRRFGPPPAEPVACVAGLHGPTTLYRLCLFVHPSTASPAPALEQQGLL